MTKPRVGRPRNLVSILGKGKTFFRRTASKPGVGPTRSPYRMATGGCKLGGVGEEVLKLPTHDADHSLILLPRLRVNGAAPLLSHLPSGAAQGHIRGRTIKFANSRPCACRGSTGQKPWYGLMTLTYQRFTAVLLLIYGSLFLSGIY